MSFLRVLVSLGRIFHRLFRKLVSGLVVFFVVMCRSDKMGVRRKIVELGSSLVPVVSANLAMVASVAAVAHELLFYGIKLNSTMPISRPPLPIIREMVPPMLGHY